ncbi:recombinase family protein [Streptantibioticus ferralitis]
MNPEDQLILVAFAGRTSTDDQQDPTLSLPRQLRNSQKVLPDNAVIVAHFYDIESGRMDLAARGRGHAHEQFQIPIPRDGGIQDLLNEAARPDRRFNVVICESIERISRRTYFSTEIEHRLEQAGVLLLASDEPINLDAGARKARTATQILTRRVKQGVAEWYVTEMLEKSWAGFEVHTEHGYNIGKACYGYRAKPVPHPVPAKRAKGVKKTLLEVHPVEGLVVRKLFGWRVVERLGYQAIADRLNLDLIINPPPTPIRAEMTVGRWTYSNVRDIITNPKYTGHMVWNRRARKGNGRNRPNPVEEWIWSPEPVHEALVDLETFVQAQQVSELRERSRSAAVTNRHPQTKRTYRLRSYLFCTLCGRRFYGKTSKKVSYYVCAPKKSYRPDGHPASVWVPEAGMVEGLNDFLATRVFGEYRQELLDTNLETLDTVQRQERAERIASLHRAIAEDNTKSKRLVRNLELVEQPDQEFIRDINERRAELRKHRIGLEQQLARLEDEVQQAPNPDLLSRLPITPVDLTKMPDELCRQLFEALRLEIHYDRTTNLATCRITLTGETIPAVSQTTSEAVVVPFQRGRTSHEHKESKMTTERYRPTASFCVVPPAGLEPAAKRLEGACSIH